MQGSTDYLPITVYIDDVNDNVPEFVGAPYNVTIEEATPLGKSIGHNKSLQCHSHRVQESILGNARISDKN